MRERYQQFFAKATTTGQLLKNKNVEYHKSSVSYSRWIIFNISRKWLDDKGVLYTMCKIFNHKSQDDFKQNYIKFTYEQHKSINLKVIIPTICNKCS